ncbi:MAG: secretin N-terminal domain-containing protein [Pseudomonadota bacterium]
MAMLLLCAGCSITAPQDADFPRYQEPDSWPEDNLPVLALSVRERVHLPVVQPVPGAKQDGLLYSFVISDMGVDDGLRQFARAYDLNILVDPDVTGMVDVDFRDVPLERALSLMLDSLDFYWTIDGGVIRVRSQETRLFSIDYLRLVRTGTGMTSATVSSSSSSAGGGGGGGEAGAGGGGDNENGSVTISQSNEIQFWKELEEQLTTLLSEDGRYVVNRLSGTVQVTDQHARVQDIAAYLEHVNKSIHRQVDIEVRIIEVALNDTEALGVNWSRVSQVLDSGTNIDFLLDGVVTSPAGGIAPLANVFRLDGGNLKNDSNLRIGAVVEALAEQGEVEIVSQPHVRTMNNQTSLIKVGTDRTFFRREQSTDSTSAGSLTTATDIPQVVTEGVVLSITPQISDQGVIMMDVSPVVTRVSSVSVVEGDNGLVRSSAPNLDVAQVSSLVRARSGETVVIGGLIQTQESDTRRSIPGISRLGPLARVLGGRYENRVRKELIMVLTPRIVATET